jgi:hypothetical protein
MIFCVQLTTIFLTTGQRPEAAIMRPSTPPPPPPPEPTPAPMHTSTAPAPPPPEAAPAPVELTAGAEGVDQVYVSTSEAVKESQNLEAAEAGDQRKPAANENAEDAGAAGVALGKAADLVEAGLEDTELDDAEVDDQQSSAVPLEGRCYIT